MGHGVAVPKADKSKNHDNHDENNQKTRIGRMGIARKIEERASSVLTR